MTKSEQEHIDKMLEIKKQIYLTNSWKRKNDLTKYLSRLEREWEEYKKLKGTQ